MADSLDKYSKVQKKSIQIETQEGHPYKAFEFANVMQRRLDLRPRRQAQRIVSYAYLIDVTHAAGILIGLVFTHPVMSVRIEGKNLQGLVDLLREEKITAIQEYIPEWHVKPADGEPVINKLQITTPTGSKVPTPIAKH